MFCKQKFEAYGEGEIFNPRWGFIVPHTLKAPGATSVTGLKEYFYGEQLCDLVDLPHATRNKAGVKGAAKRLVDVYKANAIIEPHFNAFNTKVSGAEILVLKGDDLSIRYAEFALLHFEDTFPDRKIRGIKEMSKGGRGYWNLKHSKNATKGVAMLSELFFGDNENDYMNVSTQANFWRDFLNVGVPKI